MDTPYHPAPAPPPGPALLDDNESNMLDNFFTTMDSNRFSNDFGQRDQQNKSLDSFNFDWSNELPPTFEGSTTSLSQPTHPPRPPGKPNGGMNRNEGSTSSDILAAASMLFQNGMNEPQFDSPFDHSLHPDAFTVLNRHPSGVNSHDKGLPTGSRTTGKEQDVGPPRSRLPVGYHTSEMLFDIHEPVPVDQQPSKARALHWGSDVSFMDQGYIRPPDQPDEEQRTKELLNNLECLERQSSATNTRAPSPERMGNHANWSGDMRTAYTDNLDDGSPLKKRQRSLIKEEDDDETSDADSSKVRTRRPKGSSFSSKAGRASNDSVRKSRLQQTTKPTRENLTEEQKRTNHILSEQKRRNLIRQGFDDLCSLVPGLRGGGFSKSAMLTQAADWLEDVLRGNEILQAQLSELKAVNGSVMPR